MPVGLRDVTVLGVLCGALLAGCQTPMVGKAAPEIIAGDWVLPRDGQVPDLSNGRWRLLAFFSPG